MPKMGAARTGAGSTSLLQSLRRGDLTGDATKPLEDEIRKGAEKAATEQLEHLRAVQSRVYNREGRIKRARFHAAVLALRFEGFTPTETAHVLGCSHARVDKALLRMREAASVEDQLLRLDNIAVPLAVDNAIRGVMDGDRAYTMKVLDGRGVFRSHKSIEAQVTKRSFEFRVVTTMPPGMSANSIPMPNPGAIIGTPDIPMLPGAAPPAPEDE